MKYLIVVAIITIFVVPSYAGTPQKPTVVLSISPQKLKIKAGETKNIKFNVKLQKKWHVYGIIPKENKDGIGPQATEITLKDSTKSLTIGKVISPKTKTEYDEGFEMDVESLEGNLQFTVSVTASLSASGKLHPILGLYFQICDGKTCLTPEEKTISFQVEIVK